MKETGSSLLKVSRPRQYNVKRQYTKQITNQTICNIKITNKNVRGKPNKCKQLVNTSDGGRYYTATVQRLAVSGVRLGVILIVNMSVNADLSGVYAASCHMVAGTGSPHFKL